VSKKHATRLSLINFSTSWPYCQNYFTVGLGSIVATKP